MKPRTKKHTKINKDSFKKLDFKVDVGIGQTPDDCEVCKVERMAVLERLEKRLNPAGDTITYRLEKT